MKKRNMVSIFAMLLAAVMILGGCSSGGKAYDMNETASSESFNYFSDDAGAGGNMVADEAFTEEVFDELTGEVKTEAVTISTERKIIMTANVTVETKEYDSSYEELLKLINKSNGYVSESDYQGVSIENYGRRSRYCVVTARVPAENYNNFITGLETVGNVSYSNESQSDVTTQYYDLQARIESLQVQENRLLELLEKAENVEAILQIEAQLSDVRYQIESYQTKFKILSDSVSYSTVTVELQEVVEYSKEPVQQLTFGQKMLRRLSDGWEVFVDFCQGFVLVVFAGLPFIVLVAAIVVVIVLLCKKSAKRRKKNIAAGINAVEAEKNENLGEDQNLKK